MSADDDLALVADERPLVVELARALSLASHVDVALVRALRTRLFADADVSTEADLWSSILVESRGEGELALRNDIREALWQELRDEPAVLRAHWDALTDVRGPAPPLLQLEERLTFAALDRDLAAIDRELRTVITAMRDDPDRRRNLAAWSAQALDHLPAEVRDTEAARILGNVARAWVATPPQIAEMTPAVDSMELVQQLQPTATTTLSIYLRRVGDTLEVTTTPPSPTGWLEIPRVPATSPMLIVDHDRPVPLDLRTTTRIPVRGPRIMIGTVDKRRWWLEPEPPLPSLASIFTLTDDTGSPHAAYLVAPDQAVTTARWLTGIASGPAASSQLRQVAFTGRTERLDDTRARDILALDEDADIALVRLSTTVDDPPLELDPDVRQGQSWQAFSSGRRTVGTIATAWPGVTLRWPTNVPPPPPGTPIFSGTKVIGHVATDPIRNGLLHTVSARLIRWWLDQVSRTSSAHHRANAAQTAQATPDVSAETPASSDFSPSVFSAGDEPNAPAESNAPAQPHAAAATHANVPAPNASMAPRVWVHSKPSTEVPRELTFQGAATAAKDDLVVVFVGNDERRRPAAVYRVLERRHARQSKEGSGYDRPQLAEPTSTEIRATRIVDLPPPPEELLRENQRAIASCANVTPQRDTRNLGIHDTLVDLLWRLQTFEAGPARGINRERAEARDRLLRLFGPPPSGSAPRNPPDGPLSGESITTLPVTIELPASISTGGLLGTTLAHDRDVRRFRRHQWGDHEVTIVVGTPAQTVPNNAIRVKITDFEMDPRLAMMEFGARVFRNQGKEAFYDACGAPPVPFATEVFRGPRRGGTPGTYDLELIVNRMPHVAPANAHRRGVQFVIAALDAMEHAGEPRSIDVLHIPGCGDLDLADAQQRVRAAGIHDMVVMSIDPETDLVERRYSSTANPSYSPIAAALGGEVAAVFGGPPAVSDLLTHRFGVARERAGRAIVVSRGNPTRISVVAMNDAPVRGYVAIYFTTAENRIRMQRIRAEDGLASCELPRRGRGYTIGAVIEDEGLLLEAFVDAEPTTGDATTAGAEADAPAQNADDDRGAKAT